MDSFKILQRSGVITAIARHEELSPPVAAAVSAGLVPLLVEGMRAFYHQAGGGGAGLRALAGLLDDLGEGDAVYAMLQSGDFDSAPAHDILRHVFGSVAAANDQATEIAAGHAVGPDAALRILVMLTMGIGGYLSARLAGIHEAEREQLTLDTLLP